MELTHLHEADQCLSKCGRPLAPKGMTAVYLYRAIPIQTNLATGSATNIGQEITGDTVFELRAISVMASSTTALYCQIQLPDGTFLFNNLIDISQIGGYGSTRYVFTKPRLCPPGTRVTVTYDTSLPGAASAQPMDVLLEGADRYLLQGGRLVTCLDAFSSSLPRYGGDSNQNILAPCWQQGFTLEPPPGFVDEHFVYASGPQGQGPGTVTVAQAGPLTATVQINIDQGYWFDVRRLLVWVTADASITAGSFLGRVRDSSGYSLTDDYVDLARYLGSAPWPKGWTIDPGGQIYIDLELVDCVGSTNMYFQCFAEGVRRRRG